MPTASVGMAPDTKAFILPAIGLADQADQLDDVVDLHLLQHAGPVFGDRLLADPQLAGDLLGMLAGHQPIEHLALTVRERLRRGPSIRPSAPPAAAAGRRGRSPPGCGPATISRLNGFSKKSIAPALMACTAMGISAQPEIMMMGTALPWAARASCSPSPLSPGIRTSSTTHLGRVRRVAEGVEKRLRRQVRLRGQARAADHQAQRFAHLRIVVDDIHGCGCTRHPVTLFLRSSLERSARRPHTTTPG